MKTRAGYLLVGFYVTLAILAGGCNSDVVTDLSGSTKTVDSSGNTGDQEDNLTPVAPPVLGALDTDQNGELSSAEIDNASVALMTLDTNGDGVLSRDELCPGRPEKPNEDNGTEPPPGPGRGRGMERSFGPPADPVIKVLDADQDGEISSAEIDNASAALMTLDTNGDGVLSRDELCPERPEAPNGDNVTEPPGLGRGHRMGPPGDLILRILDTDHDGTLSATEIDNASSILQGLDTNGDGELTRDEFCPAGKGPD
jgi:Ca2+-binding EF-hand superfamily protein